MPRSLGNLLTPEEVAERVGLKVRAVYNAVRNGDLRAYRVSNRIRIREEDYEAWVLDSEI